MKALEKKGVHDMEPLSKRGGNDSGKSIRDTCVVELLTKNPIGLDDLGSKKTKRFLSELSEKIGIEPVLDPQTHLSELYGFSGWIPGKKEGDAAAIHTYIWDDRSPSFVSVDVSFPEIISDETHRIIKAFTADFFDADEVVMKSTSEDFSWRELEESIYRQRLSLVSLLKEEVSDQEVSDMLKDLCSLLKMKQLGNPFVLEGNAWQHWETSGVLVGRSKDELQVDIYTCKPFEVCDAVEFFENRIGKVVFSQEF